MLFKNMLLCNEVEMDDMKVIHIESGLGNQMLSYAEYLVIKKLNPNDECYIETMIYDIPECNDVISQWHGYELERVFNIHAPNIKQMFENNEWISIVNEVKASEFWNDGWRYAPIIVDVLKKHGLDLVNLHGNEIKYRPPTEKSIKDKIFDCKLAYDIKRWLRPLYQEDYRKRMDSTDRIFVKTDQNIYAGQMLGLRNYGANIDFVRKEIKESFCFPSIEDEKNKKVLASIMSENSVAIHARRGDMLQSNGYCYKYGYFRRATKYIKKNVDNPVFYFFCDTGSIKWCKENQNIFGLDMSVDKVKFVDWNTGMDYYRDMQLMSYCKHNIITNSSFGWWGAWMNDNPNKITISPNVWNNTTHHF